ncbi:MAG TPA: VWA-like domain-containing protein [Streptosporangiaceae bacterium]|jgi:predicted metal-dependent peptidase|nr:VWA-like domain-containing protein [Streptosporangiaceae bacterium]
MTAPDASGSIPGLAAARLWAAARYPYLASGIFGARVVAAPGIRTVAVDPGWRMWADPDLTANWTAAELGSVLVHHVCHLLREHGPRAGMAGVQPDEARTWIRSADAEINDDLVPAGLTLPGDPVLPRHLGCPPGQLTEQYFAATRGRTAGLGQPVATSGDGHPGDHGDGGQLDCGSGADGFGRPWEASRPAVLPPWQARLLQRLVAQQILAGKEAGNVPAGLLRWADGVLAPKVDWRRALAAELRKAVADTAGAVDYSYRRPSRRASAAGNVVLPALRRPVPEVAVVCDTSGSMSDDLLAASLAEVEGLLGALGLARRLRVLACDTAVGPSQRVTSARQVELVGGGGTDMGAGIAAAAALRPRPAVIVVLTDGYTPWPKSAPRGSKVVVGLLGDEAPDAPDWARAIRVPS